MPVSPDDFPVIGGTRRYSNLFLNVGHGFRGGLSGLLFLIHEFKKKTIISHLLRLNKSLQGSINNQTCLSKIKSAVP